MQEKSKYVREKMIDKEVLKKLVLILGLANATFGSVLDNKLLLVIGGIISIIGTIMILGMLKW